MAGHTKALDFNRESCEFRESEKGREELTAAPLIVKQWDDALSWLCLFGGAVFHIARPDVGSTACTNYSNVF